MSTSIYLLLAVLVALQIFISSSKARRLINKIPGPLLPIPFIGNILYISRTSQDGTWDALLHLAENFYPIYQLQLLWRNFVVTRNPDDARILLSCKENLRKSHLVYDNMKYMGVDGLLINDGEKWATRRKMLNPAFSQPILKIYADIDEEHADDFIQDMRSGDPVKTPSVFPMFHRYVLKISCEAILGVNVNKVPAEVRERLTETVQTLASVSCFRAARPFIADWMMPFISEGRKQIKLTLWANKWVSEILEERRRSKTNEILPKYHSFKDNVDGDEDIGITKGRKQMAVMDLLLAAQEANLIDEHGVHEELLIFMSGSYETTGALTSFAIIALAAYKEIQDRARSEVRGVIKKNGGKIPYSALQELEYLDRCLQEVLRLYPPVPLFGRTLEKETQLKDYLLPAGTEVFVHVFALHRDPKFWSDPLKFDPDRFRPEAVHMRHPFSFLPFSAGVRNCIGRRFAILGAKMIISKILDNFYLEPVEPIDEIKFKFSAPLKPIEPMHVKFIRIDKE